MNPSPRHRFRLRHWLMGITALVLVGGGVFLVLWEETGAHEVSYGNAVGQFDQSTKHHKSELTATARTAPAAGVYAYVGTGNEHLSLPPKTQHDGPEMPGTVTEEAHGCWRWRLDFSNSHYQFTEFCPGRSGLAEPSTGGWSRWDFVATSIEDTATFTCSSEEMAVPEVLSRAARYPFRCAGTNAPLKLKPTTLLGSARYLESGSIRVSGHAVPAVRVIQVGRFTGGQTGHEVANYWFDRATGLPLAGTWTEVVTTPLGPTASTLTANGSFHLAKLTPTS